MDFDQIQMVSVVSVPHHHQIVLALTTAMNKLILTGRILGGKMSVTGQTSGLYKTFEV